ncbi:heterokaryon incompatibility protein-domain-containing protein [Paraphoma chrysanthemicola]|nr:heterokaryon incompatibility protein-domain-containing protein [Paraphoma chrysanthemicola]
MGTAAQSRNAAAESFMAKRWCALHIAAHRGFSSIARLLLDGGADVNVMDTDGCSPLDVAIRSSNYETALSLYARGCTLNMDSEQFSHFMSIAVGNEFYPSVQSFIGDASRTRIDKSLLRTSLHQRNSRALSIESSLISTPSTRGFQDNSTLLCSQSNRSDELKTFVTTLCSSCSRVLEKLQGLALVLPASSTGSCRLCCLFRDYGIHQSVNAKIRNEFKGNIGMPGIVPPELSIYSDVSKTTHRLPVRQITNEWHYFLHSLNSEPDRDTSSTAAISMANRWLQTCVKGHIKCGHDSDTSFTPTRLIELREGETWTLKLLQGVEVCAPYVALSHRWGTEELPRTTSKNIDDRLHQIRLNELTATMRDAIAVTRSLGFRHIWIDALCIVQDSEEDWLREATQMCQVFRNAIVTLAVADAVNHSQGMFRNRRGHFVRPFWTPYSLDVPYRERISIDGEGEFYAFSNVGLVSSERRPKGPLDTRGWILQEQLISPRILYFGDGELFWDCTTISASESSPISSSLLNDENSDETWALKLIRKNLAGSISPDTLQQRFADIWVHIIMNYSARQLSKQSDRLIALQGIMRPLTALLQEDPVAGMWKTQLWRQLIWWVQEKLTSPLGIAVASFPAPTWSWLGTRSPVLYYNSLAAEHRLWKRTVQMDHRIPATEKFTDLEPFIKVDSVETTTLPGAIGVQGTLTISGPAFRYRLTTNDRKKTAAKIFNASKWKLNTGKWLLDLTTELPLELHCIIVAEDTAAKMLVCMCLVPDNLPSRWRRIGICHWDGLKWQVAKYVGKEPEEMTFIIV